MILRSRSKHFISYGSLFFPFANVVIEIPIQSNWFAECKCIFPLECQFFVAQRQWQKLSSKKVDIFWNCAFQSFPLNVAFYLPSHSPPNFNAFKQFVPLTVCINKMNVFLFFALTENCISQRVGTRFVNKCKFLPIQRPFESFSVIRIYCMFLSLLLLLLSTLQIGKVRCARFSGASSFFRSFFRMFFPSLMFGVDRCRFTFQMTS